MATPMYPTIHISVCSLDWWCDLHQRGFELGSIALVLTLLVICCYIRRTDDTAAARLLSLQITAAAWAIIPPVYFLAEWWLYNPPNAESFEAFKYDQQTAKDLWAGVGAVLGVLLLRR